MIGRLEIISVARKQIGVPWRHQGRGVALDCVGLVIVVAKQLGICAPGFDFKGYSRRPDGHKLTRLFAEHLRQKPITKRAPGDVVIIRDSVFPCHCGILSINGRGLTLIHAFARAKRVIEEPYGNEWLMQSTHCLEFPGVEPWAN